MAGVLLRLRRPHVAFAFAPPRESVVLGPSILFPGPEFLVCVGKEGSGITGGVSGA